MPRRTTGRYERTTVGGEDVAAFVPHARPPARPPVVIDVRLAERLHAAEQALVRLELAGEMVPSLDWILYAFVRKEAVLSSQIEGTQATLSERATTVNAPAPRSSPRTGLAARLSTGRRRTPRPGGSSLGPPRCRSTRRDSRHLGPPA